MRALTIAVVAMLAGVGGCATVEQQTRVTRPANVETFSSVGDVMVRMDMVEDLPNAWGRADVWGGTRDRGFSELRFMGLSADGLAVFRRRDVDIMTNETTMSRYGLGTANVTAHRSGNRITGTAITTQTAPPSIEALPPDTIQFALDLREGRVITMRDKTIEILDATSSGVRFIIR